ncbi:MAG: RNA polymerase sigma factor FliA [Gammaproteobacteria bacterium]|jgi:RNA polymerase sigma factor for flagellar operon FliA|nr:RNA polymerase sigma factor FliA [Gammaproteobacteria bacterium]MBT3859552.1 RNA polymerase sigma factor FliA [Gammaproteobacteria bacterium]MBT3986554.1 RNA polymerase sigma factor FliA [Gammaproteobacteria bacterium]MBT4254758.1 RNA polymerase sigma factor FliA [Gammaproteobacteria bacterium]MBT4581102.1 RNA polymerase sigma factor FliA [Gammaproteobacteria bacterium]
MTSVTEAKVYENVLPGGIASDENLTMVVERYAPLVKRIAHHLLLRMPASVQIDDLIQSGMIGLLEAAKKYDVSKGASFETYAGIRIRGSMLDEVRKGDWAPRSVHRKSRKVAEAIKAIEARTGKDAQDKDIADELEIDLNAYYAILQDASGSRLFSFDDIMEGDDSAIELAVGELPGPCDGLQRSTFKASLSKAIDGLPDREKLVLALYYDEELNLKEIGEVIGVSESRVSQIHSQAAQRLRGRLTEWS